MDSKIKRLTIAAFAICSFFLTGCKENKWVDWKMHNDAWLEQNKTKDSVQVRASGLQYKIIADPLKDNDVRPNTTSDIICDYTLKLINGYIIESNYNATLDLSNCIPGFAEGCHLIHAHGDIELYIPYYLGYDYQKKKDNDLYNAEGNGTEGTQSYIPPYSTLIYRIHLCSVVGE